jgi:hypothetical protein
MRTLLVLTAAAALAAAPAFAQQPLKTDPAPGGPAASAAPSGTETPPTHEMCKTVMGAKMDAKHPHDHGRDKTGAPTWPNGKPLSKAEMDKMHQQCAARLAAAKK